MNRIKELPKSSSHLLSSTQLVTSIYCVIKELVENSLDSSAKNIDIKLVDYGLEKIEVKDNGSGIHKDDICFVAKPHCTSKITTHLDLDLLDTYGFRGEALAALCAVSDLTISTKTVDDEFGNSYTFDHKGEILTSKPCSLNQGTVVTALNLFKNVPVRKQLYRNSRVKNEELKKIENLLIAFGCIQAGLRFSLYHNQNLIWQKLTARSTSEGLQQVFGSSVFEHFKNYSYADDKTQLIKEHYSKTLETGVSPCYPICYVAIKLPKSEVDVNFEPNKTIVAMQNMDLVVQHFSEALNRFYSNDLNVEISSEINKEIIRKEMPSFQKKPYQLETHIQNVALKESGNFSSDKTNSENVASTNLMQKSLLKQRCESLTSSQMQMTSKRLSQINDTITSSSKRVKTSSNISIPSTPIEKHIQTLDSYFSSKENSIDQPAVQNVVTNIPIAVTLQRNSIDSNINAEFISNSTVSAIRKTPNLEQPASVRRRHSSDLCIVKSCNNTNQTLSISNVSIDKWSRGIHPIGDVQPVVILKPKITENNKSPNENILKNADSKRESFGAFQNQRKMTPYDIFCRRNRLEVASLNPNLNNQQIAQILTEKWDQLSPDEKASYTNLNKDFPKNIKKQREVPVNASQNLDNEKTALIKCKQVRKMKVKYLEKDIAFNIKTVNNISHESGLMKVENMKVINSISPGIWICFQENKLYLLNSFRLQEVVVYQRLLETFQLEADVLDSPYVIPTSFLDKDDMDKILKMNHTIVDGNGILISDERLTANGFKLKLLKDEHKIHVEIIGITKSVASYCVQDLKEILSLIKDSSVYKNLSDCRPSKVVLYLQGEAVRITRQYPMSKKLEDIEDLLKQQKSSDTSLHLEPFLHVLFTMSTNLDL